MAALEEETAGATTRLELWIAFDYGGRAELVEAARRIVEAGVARDEVDEDVFAAYLYAPEHARPRPADPHLRRAADLELPALAARVRGVRLRRHALARLRRGRAARRRWPRTRAGSGGSAADELVLVADPRRGRGIPLVLWLVWLGGWWLFGLALVAGADRAARVLYWMTRPLRPVVARRLSRRDRSRCSERELGGLGLGARRACSRRFALAFVLKGVADTGVRDRRVGGDGARRRSGSASASPTLLLLRDIPEHGVLALYTVAARGLGRRHGRLLHRPPHRPAQARADGLAGQDVGGLRRPARSRRSSSRSSRSTTQRLPRRSGSRSCSGSRSRSLRPLGDLFESALKRDMRREGHRAPARGPRRDARPDRRAPLRLRSPPTTCVRGRSGSCEAPTLLVDEANRAARRHRLDRPAGDRDHRRRTPSSSSCARRVRLERRSTGCRRRGR